MSTWDYIVVGAGSSGCVVANRLSQNAADRVLLLEAGPPAIALMKVLGAARYVDLTRYDWGYYSQPDPTRELRRDRWLRGRCVGGTSSINGTNYVRGSPADYDRWAAIGNQGWSASEVMPLFQSIERCTRGFDHGVDPLVRGLEGPLYIRQTRHAHSLTEAFIQAACAAGFPRNVDYNSQSQEGVGLAQLNQRRGLRWSAADAFLRPVLHRPNLRLITEARVLRLIFDGSRVSGLCYEKDRRLQEVTAKRVILCAGAINTPQLLMLSGVGDTEELNAVGIPVVLERKAVGRNLMEHPLVRVVCRTHERSYNPAGGLLHKAGLLAKFLFAGEGPLACVVEAQAFLRTHAALAQPDIQLHFLPVGMGYALDNPYYVLPKPSFTVLINKSYPNSRGRIKLASADPTAPPIIEPDMLREQADVATLVSGIQTVRRILAMKPMAARVLEEVHPGRQASDGEALADYVRHHTEGAYHPAGTCRMGTDKEAVVGPDLRVKGLENLWIADASIMPDLVSGNINAACMMIGEKLGRILTAATATRRSQSGAETEVAV